jgi:hypothetical protein
MNTNRLYPAAALAAALACSAASAQLYKCTDANGKTVFSDSKCDAAAAPIKVTPMGTTPSEREKSMAEEAAKKAEDAKKAAERKQLVDDIASETARRVGGTGAPPAAAAQPYEMTTADRERIRELEMQASSQGANAEQKRAAQMQIARIRRGADARMSSSDRAERDALMTDLHSTDKAKRTRAMNELQSRYY